MMKKETNRSTLLTFFFSGHSPGQEVLRHGGANQPRCPGPCIPGPDETRRLFHVGMGSRGKNNVINNPIPVAIKLEGLFIDGI